MRATAASLLVRGESPGRVSRAIQDAAPTLGRPAGGLILCSGALASGLGEVAATLAAAQLGFPCFLAGGAGVITERGEVEGESAAAVLLWSGGAADAWVVGETGAALCPAIAGALRERNLGAKPETALVFLRPNGVQPQMLEALRGLAPSRVVGAGTLDHSSVYAVSSEGRVSSGPGGALTLRGLPAPLVTASPACRLLMPLREISAVSGSMVLAIAGEPALEVLSTVAHSLVDQPLVFVALAHEEGENGVHPPLLLRPVQGVDPSRHGLVISDEVKVGLRLAFAVRDPASARVDLERRLRELARDSAGAAPRFGLYFDCAGRGTSLYKSPDIDLRLLKARFGDIPWVGLFSPFEIAPHHDEPALQFYTGVVSLFTSPS